MDRGSPARLIAEKQGSNRPCLPGSSNRLLWLEGELKDLRPAPTRYIDLTRGKHGSTFSSGISTTTNPEEEEQGITRAELNPEAEEFAKLREEKAESDRKHAEEKAASDRKCAELEAQLQSRPAAHFVHSEDYTSIKHHGKDFTLTPQQAAVIGLLHKHLLNGTPDLSHQYILSEVEGGNRLRDIFKGNLEAWKCLIARHPKRRGVCRLNL